MRRRRRGDDEWGRGIRMRMMTLTNHEQGLVALSWGQFPRKYSRYLSMICV